LLRERGVCAVLLRARRIWPLGRRPRKTPVAQPRAAVGLRRHRRRVARQGPVQTAALGLAFLNLERRHWVGCAL